MVFEYVFKKIVNGVERFYTLGEDAAEKFIENATPGEPVDLVDVRIK